MNNNSTMHPQHAALIAGSSLIAMAIFAAIGYGYAFNGIYSANGEGNLLNQGTLLRLTVASFTAILWLDVLVTWALHELFKSVNQALSSLMAMFRLVYTALLGIAIAQLLIAMELLKTPTCVAETIQQQLNLFLSIWSWGLVLFGMHLLVLAILVIKATHLPSAIGYLTFFAGMCYVAVHALNLLWPSFAAYKNTVEAILGVPMALGELLLAVWLIYFAIKTNK